MVPPLRACPKLISDDQDVYSSVEASSLSSVLPEKSDCFQLNRVCSDVEPEGEYISALGGFPVDVG